MAQLSAHPAILTVYQASVSADGRPYLVMELCSASLSERYRRESIPVPEVLRIAVKIGSAIETAHRAGVLHRDIKPSNILLTAYGHPVLSDFGIASEVWAFAATVYSLLAGRSPFELPGGSNSSSDLMSRIARAKPQLIGRADVPASLEALLRRAMSRRPEMRPGSVLELVRELQLIETELGVPQTAIEVAMDDWALGTVADLEERTRVRPSASAVKAPVRRRRRAVAAANGEYSPVGTLREVSGPGPRSNSRATRPGPVPRAVTWIIVVASALVLALGITATVVLVRAGANGSGIPVVTGISASRSGSTVRFSWQNPGLAASDRYQIQVIGGTSSIQLSPRFVVDAAAGDTVCITVAVNRDGKTGDPSAEKCVDVTDG
jgi:hypothetical protein